MPKVSFNTDEDTYQAVMDIRRPGPKMNKTDRMNAAFHDAVELRKENERLRRQLELVQLKILFLLRAIASTREEDFLKNVDRDFAAQRDELQHLIMDEGIDYVES